MLKVHYITEEERAATSNETKSEVLPVTAIRAVDLLYPDGTTEDNVPACDVKILPLEMPPQATQPQTTAAEMQHKTSVALTEGVQVVVMDHTYHPEGSLAVTGANEDSARIAQMIRTNMTDIDDIFVTLDSHHVSMI